MKRVYKFIVFIILVGICQIYLVSTKLSKTIPPTQVVGCLRTRNSGQYLTEYLNYHIGIGFDKIEVFDDSDIGNDLTRDVCTRTPRVVYYDKRGILIKKETQYIVECFKRNPSSIIMALDDDEYIVGNNIKDLFYGIVNECVYLPVKFFGTIENEPPTGLTTHDFTHRERIVKPGSDDLKKHLIRHPENINLHPDYMSYRSNQNKITRGVYKSVFKLKSSSFIKGSSSNFIHGFNMNCLYYPNGTRAWIAHHTRSNENFKTRISTFWKNINNRSQRFTGSKTFLKNYKRDRNRTEIVDNRLRDNYLKIF